MKRLGIEKIEGIVGSRQVTIHAVRHNPLGIVYMGGGFPCVVGKLNFMTRGAELGGRGADHGIIGNAKERKRNQNADNNQER